MPIVKDIEGNEYLTLVINGIEWMVENYRCTRYNDDSPITLIEDQTAWNGKDTSGAYCFMNNTTDAALQKLYGALYDFYAVDTGILAPVGWRVATQVDYENLRDFLISNRYNWDNTIIGNKIGKAMAYASDWTSSGTVGHVGNDQDSNNLSEFNLYPAGYRASGFFALNARAYCWSSTSVSGTTAYRARIDNNREDYYEGPSTKSEGLSVRMCRNAVAGDTQTLNISSLGNGSVDPSGATQVDKGDSIRIVGTPDQNYNFKQWIKS